MIKTLFHCYITALRVELSYNIRGAGLEKRLTLTPMAITKAFIDVPYEILLTFWSGCRVHAKQDPVQDRLNCRLSRQG